MHARDLALGRMRVLDAKPVNLDGFSVTNPKLGLVAMRSPHDPEPSLAMRDGVVVELDGKAVEDFDVIDEFIARYGLDLEIAPEAMALDDAVLARMTVDVNVPRAEMVRLIGGTTPAKLARVVALLTPVEMQMAMSKMRARRTPGNQATSPISSTIHCSSPPTRPAPSLTDSVRSRRRCRCWATRRPMRSHC